MITITRRPSIYTTIEKQDGYAKILVALYDVSECNIVLITSNSRRNAYPVEMVIEAKKKMLKSSELQIKNIHQLLHQDIQAVNTIRSQ